VKASVTKRRSTGAQPTRDRILDQAIDLFSRKGFSETSVREIASASGIGVSSLYTHYRNKAAILDRILAYYKGEMGKVRVSDAALKSLVERVSPAEILSRGLIKIGQSVSGVRMNRIVKILMMEMYRHPRVRKFYLAWYFHENRAAVKRLFEAMRKKGVIKAVDPEALSAFYNAIVNSYYHELFLSRAERRHTAELDRMIKNQLDAFVKLIML
jgi:AcrR family transcriptional regulator